MEIQYRFSTTTATLRHDVTHFHLPEHPIKPPDDLLLTCAALGGMEGKCSHVTLNNSMTSMTAMTRWPRRLRWGDGMLGEWDASLSYTTFERDATGRGGMVGRV
jgi:hypothetical protein